MNKPYDNNRPDDPNYPNFEPAMTAYDPLPKEDANANCIADVGDCVVDRDGDVLIATTSNRGPYGSEFFRTLNEYCIRGKYIGNDDDLLVFMNQARLCTPEEAEIARNYVQPGRVRLTASGQ